MCGTDHRCARPLIYRGRQKSVRWWCVTDDRTAVPAPILDEVQTKPVAALRQVLVVDDTPANLIAAEAALESVDCSVVKAASGAEALGCLLDQDFALILLDVSMPGMDGFETARWIRSRERSAHIPIVFISAFDHGDQAILRAYELGAVDFLYKPVYPEVLRAKVQFFVDLHERQEQLVGLRLERQYETQRRNFEAQALAREIAANEELARLNAALHARDRAKDQFITSLAHELQLPLAPVRSVIEMLKTSKEPATPKMISIVERQVQIMGRLVEDLIELAHVGSDEFQLRREAIDLRGVVETALDGSRALLQAKAYQLAVRIPEAAIPIHGDHARLVQAVANLLTNATRATPENGRITISCLVEDDSALVMVQDNGIGTPHGSHSNVAGFGIGLALAQRIVQRHAGGLSASSGGRDQGSTFVIQLPLAKRG